MAVVLPPTWNICQIINQHGGGDFPHSFIYFWKMCANPQIGFARIVESTTHRHACCWPTFNTGCLFGFVGFGGVRATSGVLFLKPQHHKKLQKTGALFSNPEISGKKRRIWQFPSWATILDGQGIDIPMQAIHNPLSWRVDISSPTSINPNCKVLLTPLN